MKHIFFTFLILFITLQFQSFAQRQYFTIDSLTSIADAALPPFNQLKPGDTLMVEPGRRDYLIIRNFLGAPGNPIVIINGKGAVILETDHYFGISIRNCRYFRFTGSGDTSIFYGIAIKRVSAGSAIGIGEMSSDFEIDHISIENASGGGIYAKTDPDCSLNSTREKFTQFNTTIHDNYIAHVNYEGLYIGSTKYFGQTVNCNGSDTLLLPSLLDGVWVYNNIIKYTGWDGIQVSSASHKCQIYNNTVMFDSQDEYFNQMSGIVIGGGSKCDCFNNTVSNGKGNGISSYGLGGYRIYNNLILEAGKDYLPLDTSKMVYGIYLNDITGQPDSSYNILFNDIINPKSDGIRFASLLSKNNLVASNVIINPGNFDFYEKGHTNFKGVDSYIMLPKPGMDVSVKNNYLARNSDLAGFEAFGYTLRPDSPLIDAGYQDTKNILFDFYHHPRPYGAIADIGAFEYNPAYPGIPESEKSHLSCSYPYPNPVRQYLIIPFHLAMQGDVVLDIMDLRGNTVMQKKYPGQSTGKRTLTADVKQLKAGVYLYSIRAGGTVAAGKFIKGDH